MQPSPTTLHDVARIAGVSIMTVSRALRAPEKLSEETLNKVRDAIAHSGYVPNELAGALASAQTRIAAAIIPSIRNSLFTSTIEGISDTFRAAGISLLVADSHYSALEEEEVLTRILGQRPCGLVLHGTTHTDRTRSMIARSGISVVEVGNLTENPLDMVASYSNAAASKAMTLHLAKRGYRRIAFVSLPVELTERAAERRRGYFEAKAEAGLEHDAAWLVEAPQGFAAGAQALNVLMNLGRRPDCVFFAGDVLAFGALMETRRNGWAVPNDIAIAGFDDHEFADQLIPAVTTLRIPRYEIGVISARMLLDRLENRVPDPVWDCGFELMQREST